MKIKSKAYVKDKTKDNFISTELDHHNQEEQLPAQWEFITEEEQLEILADIIIEQLLKQL